jgi:hypothetical protein
MIAVFTALKARFLEIFPEFCDITQRQIERERAVVAATEFLIDAYSIDFLTSLARTMPGFERRALTLAMIEFDATVEVLRDAGRLLYLHQDSTLIDHRKVARRYTPIFERFSVAS